MAEIQSEQASAGAGEHLAQFGAFVFHPGNGVKLDGIGWRGASVLEPRRTDWVWLPPHVGSMGVRCGGDITGAGGRKDKRARAVGAGDDPDVARAAADQAWQAGLELAARIESARAQDNSATACAVLAAMESDLAELRQSRAAIVAQVLAENQEGQRIAGHPAKMSLGSSPVLPYRYGRYVDLKLRAGYTTALT